MKKMKLILGVVVLFASLISSETSLAADITYETVPVFGANGDFVVGPGKVEYVIEPGDTKQAELVITNRLGVTTDFQLSVEDVAGSNDPQQAIQLLGTDRGPYSLKDYISFPTDRLELDHGQRARVPITISIPTDAEPGGKFGSVLVSVVTDETNIDTDDASMAPRSVVVSRVGALYFITVPGDVVTAGTLVDFQSGNDDTFYTAGPVDFTVLYENTGSVHLSPYGEIEVTNMFGTVIDRTEIEPWYVMPNSVRYLESRLDRRWLFGFYTVHLELHRGYENQVDQSTVTFTVIPWELMTVVATMLVVLLLRAAYRSYRVRPAVLAT